MLAFLTHRLHLQSNLTNPSKSTTAKVGLAELVQMEVEFCLGNHQVLACAMMRHHMMAHTTCDSFWTFRPRSCKGMVAMLPPPCISGHLFLGHKP